MTREQVSALHGDLRIGAFLVRPALKRLVRLGEEGEPLQEHSLPDKAMGVLVYLAENARRICERDDILNAVWGEDRDVYDRVLDNAVAEIRSALGDSSRDPNYVQTVKKRGYRLLVDPIRLQERQNPRDSQPSGARSQRQPTEQEPAERDPARQARDRPPRVRFDWLVLLGTCLPLLLVAGARPAATVIRVDAPAELYPLAREALLSERECSLPGRITVARRSASPALTIQIDERHGKDHVLTIARIQTHRDETLVSARDVPTDDASKARWKLNLRRAADREMCHMDELSDSETACICFDAAKPSLALQRPSEAIALLDRAIRLDPEFLLPYDRLSEAYAVLGESDKAEQAVHRGLERIESLDSDIALILRRRLAQQLKDFETEWTLLRELGRRQPDNIAWKVERAKHLTLFRDDCEGALDILSDAPEPIELRIGLERARALVTCARAEEAIQVLTGLVAKAPLEIEGRKWLVAALSTQERFDEAQRYAGEVLALAPEDMESMMLQAWLANATGRFPEAARWGRLAKEASRFPADHQRVDTFLIQLAFTTRDYEGCLKLTDSLEPLNSPTASTLAWRALQYTNRAECMIRLGEMLRARSILDDLLRVRQSVDDQAKARISLLFGELQFQTIGEGGTVARAIEAFDQAIRLQPYDGHYPARAIYWLEELGRQDLAEPFYRSALSSDLYSYRSHCSFGLFLHQQGRTEEALEMLEKGLYYLEGPPESSIGQECADAFQTLRGADSPPEPTAPEEPTKK